MVFYPSYLRRRVNTAGAQKRFLSKIKLQNSKNNHLLQLVDTVCGAVARSCSEKSDAGVYRRLIAHREIYAQFWPK